MPNWVMGNFKVIGIKENIQKFLLNQLELVDFSGNHIGEIIVENDIFKAPILGTSYRTFHIKDTYRCFIEPFVINFSKLKENEKGDITLNLYIKGAWVIRHEPLVEISKKYNLSFFIEAEEESGEFEQVICIRNGELIVNDEIILNEEDEWCDEGDERNEE